MANDVYAHQQQFNPLKISGSLRIHRNFKSQGKIPSVSPALFFAGIIGASNGNHVGGVPNAHLHGTP